MKPRWCLRQLLRRWAFAGKAKIFYRLYALERFGHGPQLGGWAVAQP